MDDEDSELREKAVRLIAAVMDVPVEALLMPDAEFHEWLHTTEEGRRVLDGEE